MRRIAEMFVPAVVGIVCVAVVTTMQAGVAPATALQTGLAMRYDTAAHHLPSDACARLLPKIQAMAKADPTATWLWAEETPQGEFLSWTQVEASASDHAPRLYAVPASATDAPLPPWVCGFAANSIHVVTASAHIAGALQDASHSLPWLP